MKIKQQMFSYRKYKNLN